MPNDELALALRSTLFTRSEILEFATLADESKRFRTLFFPDITSSYDSIELSAAALAMTSHLQAGSGVLRPLEHDVETLTRRLETVQFLSNNRFILGVGTGRPTARPVDTIDKLLTVLRQVRERFQADLESRQLKVPRIFMAALRPGIAKMTIGHVDGLILNFCSAQYAADLVKSVREKIGISASSRKTFACYVKIFYSADDAVARQLLISEFNYYNRNPQYHQMFEREGITRQIAKASFDAKVRPLLEIPNSLDRISLANPSVDQLTDLVKSFRSAGVDLPCLYPYFALNDDAAFKLGVMEELLSIV